MNTKQRWKHSLRYIYIALCLLSAFASASGNWYLNVAPYWSEGFFGSRTLVTVGLLFVLVYFFFAKMYEAYKIGIFRLRELIFSQMLAYLVADFFLLVAMFFWFHNFSRINLCYFAGIFFLQLLFMLGITFLFNRFYAHFDEPRKIMIVYGAQGYQRLVEKMRVFTRRYRIVSIISEKEIAGSFPESLPDAEDVYLWEVTAGVKEQLIIACDRMHKDVHASMELGDILLMGNEVSHSFDTPFWRNRKIPVVWYYPIVKRAMDILLSLMALLLLSPLMLVTAAAIYVYDRGPVFYSQERLTKQGKIFRIYKFRSMRTDSERNGAQLSTMHDPRITPVGELIRKFRVDELPQLLNVLLGDMSIVGPRPERPEIAADYEKELPEFSLRLKTKAGLTGYAQVYGKYNTTPLDKLKLDLIYISQRSILFDLRIMVYTLKVIFKPESTEGIADDQTNAMR